MDSIYLKKYTDTLVQHSRNLHLYYGCILWTFVVTNTTNLKYVYIINYDILYKHGLVPTSNQLTVIAWKNVLS